LNERLRRPDNRIGKLLAQSDAHRAAIESMFWNALTRPPTDQEVEAVLQMIGKTGDPRVALEDLTWALLNAKELIFRN